MHAPCAGGGSRRKAATRPGTNTSGKRKCRGAGRRERDGRCQTACKPGSVPAVAAAGDGHSSGTPVAGRLARPTRTTARKTRLAPRSNAVSSLLGLAPGGVYRAVPVAGNAVRSYRTLSPLPADRGPKPTARGRRFAFCGTVPGVTPAGRYPAPCFPWSPDFPPPPAPFEAKEQARAAIRPSGTIFYVRRRWPARQGRPEAIQPASTSVRPCSNRAVAKSMRPLTRAGRKWRWNARSAAVGSAVS